MSTPKKTLFVPVVGKENLHPNFEILRTNAVEEAARWMLDDVYQDFEDPDGNFLEQFQTTGFDSRFFEIYLHAYFSRTGFVINRTKPKPDFIVSRSGVTVAVEATTVNPSTSGILAKIGKKISEMSPSELEEYRKNELPIRFGSPLFSKLNKRYWELDHCKNIPLVIAIQAFHDEEALTFADSALTSYLFGIENPATFDGTGRLRVESESVEHHQVNDKKIPSGFFSQPETEHISAVMFTNSGTHAKFSRMGFQHGIATDRIFISRVGFCFAQYEDALDPTYFNYSLDYPPFVEPWGQGLIVLHNPKCLNPLPEDFFVHSAQVIFRDGFVRAVPQGWHPFSSKTFIIDYHEGKKEITKVLPPYRINLAVGAIAKNQFRDLTGIPENKSLVEEQGWFSDETGAFLGVVFRDKTDDDWRFAILGRDQFFTFRAIKTESSLATRTAALMKLQISIARLLSSPQRIFPQ
jgi:hypothetical protein